MKYWQGHSAITLTEIWVKTSPGGWWIAGIQTNLKIYSLYVLYYQAFYGWIRPFLEFIEKKKKITSNYASVCKNIVILKFLSDVWFSL